jgi:hypothetical protein
MQSDVLIIGSLLWDSDKVHDYWRRTRWIALSAKAISPRKIGLLAYF